MQNNSLIPLKSLIFTFHATNTIIISFLPLYLQYKGLSGTEIGWVLAIGPFASIISQPLWGYISDKYRTVKWVLISTIICTLIVSILFFQMNHLAAILVFGGIFYFFSSPIGALSDSFAQRRALDLGVSFGTIRMWGSLGFAFSSLVVGEILGRAGIEWIVYPYVILGTTLLLISFTLKDVKTDAGAKVQLSDIRLILQNKTFMFFLLCLMFITITHRANDSFVGIYIKELGGSESLVGTGWFIAVISEAIIFASAGFWFRKFHSIQFIIAIGALFAVRWLLYGVIENPYLIIGLQVLHGITFAGTYIAAFDYVTKIIPETLQATGHLIFYSVMFGVSGIIGSLGGGYLLDVFNGHILYFGMGLLSFIGTFAFILYYTILKKQISNT